jgi:ubiquinone/menaquinone biosynthesis C-methylase UbiE
MELTDDERRLLTVIWQTQRRLKRMPGAEALRDAFAEDAKDDAVDANFDAACERLSARGWLHLDSAPQPVRLVDSALTLARDLNLEQMRRDFGEWMIRSEQSPAYARFCERVYGMPLIQFNMIDAVQMQALLEAIDARPEDRVVDLGCGVGTITEYLGQRTGALMTGIDFSEAAISRAADRCAAQGMRTTFQVADLNRLDLPSASFDVAIALDTLYFVDDLQTSLRDILALLVPGGRFVAFYSATRREQDDEHVLRAESTHLAQALTALGCEFSTRDFSDRDLVFWQNCRKATDDMRSEFEAEGNAKLWSSRDKETAHILKIYEEGRMRRHLYRIALPKA